MVLGKICYKEIREELKWDLKLDAIRLSGLRVVYGGGCPGARKTVQRGIGRGLQ